ncbi:MAG: thiamine diphosphokinase [Clostridia bacterium]|nr:thiamine diphosphokinase [Clostridia bacterium]
MRAVIFAGGEIKDYVYAKSLLNNEDMLLAADSGLEHLIKMGLEPDIMIGDMDSVKSEVLGKEIIRLEVIKDETDTEAAMRVAIERGADEILLLGAMGSRKDHSLANVLLLKRLNDLKIKASVVDEKNEIYYLDKSITINGNMGDTVSILPLSDIEGISTEGLFYRLDNDALCMGTSRGVSNVMLHSECRITVRKGNALVIRSRD